MSQFLEGQLLIATPAITDERFHKSVIFICSHDKNHAMGLVLNKVNKDVNFKIFCDLMSIKTSEKVFDHNIRIGGPMDTNRGFVLHSDEVIQKETLSIAKGIALTSTSEFFDDLSKGKGPKNSILALGYAGWGAGQIELEIASNSWMTLKTDSNFIFDENTDEYIY